MKTLSHDQRRGNSAGRKRKVKARHRKGRGQGAGPKPVFGAGRVADGDASGWTAGMDVPPAGQ